MDKISSKQMLKLIEEEVQHFIKKKIIEEKYSKLVSEFSDVFAEVLELNESTKKTVKNQIAMFLTEYIQALHDNTENK